MNAVERLESDLTACGMPKELSGLVCNRYARALETGAPAEWERFYQRLFFAMSDLGAHPGFSGSREAFETVMRILEDDLGWELFGELRLGKLRSARARHAAAVSF